MTNEHLLFPLLDPVVIYCTHAKYQCLILIYLFHLFFNLNLLSVIFLEFFLVFLSEIQKWNLNPNPNETSSFSHPYILNIYKCVYITCVFACYYFLFHIYIQQSRRNQFAFPIDIINIIRLRSFHYIALTHTIYVYA